MALIVWLTAWPIYSNWHIEQLSRPTLRALAHRIHQGVLYCQKATRFHWAHASLASHRTHPHAASPHRTLHSAGSSSRAFSQQNVTNSDFWHQLLQNACTKLHENPVNCLHTDTVGRGTDWYATKITSHEFKFVTDICFKIWPPSLSGTNFACLTLCLA